jgi:hypothetical protein
MFRDWPPRVIVTGLDVRDESRGERFGLPFDAGLVAMTGQEPCDKIGRRMGGESSESVELVRRLRIVLEHDVRQLVADDRVTAGT